jgi:hypothetical protein
MVARHLDNHLLDPRQVVEAHLVCGIVVVRWASIRRPRRMNVQVS